VFSTFSSWLLQRTWHHDDGWFLWGDSLIDDGGKYIESMVPSSILPQCHSMTLSSWRRCHKIPPQNHLMLLWFLIHTMLRRITPIPKRTTLPNEIFIFDSFLVCLNFIMNVGTSLLATLIPSIASSCPGWPSGNPVLMILLEYLHKLRWSTA